MSNKTILVVDDSEAEQFLCKHLISRFDSDIEVHEACDGEVALDMLESSDLEPDIILLDINMPCMTGFQFLDVCAQRLSQTKARVAMFSSSIDEKDWSKARGYEPVKWCFEKPLTKDHLEACFPTA